MITIEFSDGTVAYFHFDDETLDNIGEVIERMTGVQFDVNA